MKKPYIKVHQNGATVRIKNRRISFTEDNGILVVLFQFAGAKDGKATNEVVIRGVKETTLRITSEALEALVITYMKYRKYKEDGTL